MNDLAITPAERVCGSVLAAARKAIGALDARVLLEHAIGCAAADVMAHPERVLTLDQHARYRAAVQRRARGEPVAYIVGEREFYGRSFRVSPDVLIPRPETELLVELALAHMPLEEKYDVLDLGTGSGCVALTLAAERPRIRVTAVDISDPALNVAKANARALSISNVCFLLSDWFAALDDVRVELIVANPPYVADADPHLAKGDVCFEPPLALCGGADGLSALRTIIAASREHLAPGGSLYLEHGYDQAPAVRELLVADGYVDVVSYRDMAGIERVSGGRFPD
ncbi:MAG TPA: peptide chain release factor N(5)-glutamine methyltransferase [Burkholderiales bacterium]|nr:peptide chain release factor N(5)-glutamine methyltransferase [Burkholderiales bacterium]